MVCGAACGIKEGDAAAGERAWDRRRCREVLCRPGLQKTFRVVESRRVEGEPRRGHFEALFFDAAFPQENELFA